MLDPESFNTILIGILNAIVVGGTALLCIAAASYILLILWRHRNRDERSLDWVLLQVALPHDNEIKIDAAEQMFAGLCSLRKHSWFSWLSAQEHISFEIAALPENIRFYVGCPAHLRDLVEKQIHGSYPIADITAVEEYNIFSEDGFVSYASLSLGSPSYLPLKFYKDLAVDPLSLITSQFAKLSHGEGAALQILISPVSSGWRASGRSFIAKVKKREANPDKATYSYDQKTLESIDNKCSKPGFNTAVRIVVSAKTKEAADANLENITGAFAQFNSDHNHFKKDRIFLKPLFVSDFIYRYFPLFRQKSILNVEELATLYHFPNKTVETPHIFWLNSKRAPAPQQILSEGLFLGNSSFRGVKRPVYIGNEDRLRHTYIIGKTGTGKSELLKQMILQDIKAGKGVCFIDPHDTIDKLLEEIPPERAEDVILFDPSNLDRPMGLNMIEAETEQQMHLVATSIIGLMYKLYDPHQTGMIGPRFEHAIRNAMLTVMVEPGATFVEVVRILTDPSYVQMLLPKVKDPIIRRFWTDQIAQTAEFHKSETLDYIVSKFGRFVTNKMMRNIIGQSKSSFNFRKVMDEGKILLVSLAKGKIGEENSSFLGSILVPKILVAAMSRQDISEDQRRDFFLYVDEFQNFATPDFAQILSEARKYHLALIVANQFVSQMEDDVKQAVFGNVGTLMSFRVGVADAQFLAHEFAPVFSEQDLVNVDKYNCYVKTIVHNEPVSPFSLDLTKDMNVEKERRNPRVAEMIRQLSSLKYGRNIDEVETEIAQRARL